MPQMNPMMQQMPQTYPNQYPPMMQQRPQMMMGQQPQPQMLIPPVQFDEGQLASISDINERKNYIGNIIYHPIEHLFPSEGGRITGMLLDEKVVEIDKLIKDNAYLNEKVREAYQLIKTQTMMAGQMGGIQGK